MDDVFVWAGAPPSEFWAGAGMAPCRLRGEVTPFQMSIVDWQIFKQLFFNQPTMDGRISLAKKRATSLARSRTGVSSEKNALELSTTETSTEPVLERKRGRTGPLHALPEESDPPGERKRTRTVGKLQGHDTTETRNQVDKASNGARRTDVLDSIIGIVMQYLIDDGLIDEVSE